MTARRIIFSLCAFGLLPALAACAEGNTATSLAPTPASATPAAPTAPPKPPPLTATQINEQCWLDPAINKVADIDKRLKLVDKCVDQKTKAQQGQ